MDTATKPQQIRLSTTPSRADLEALKIGDIVYLDGLLYTAREGVYKKVLEEDADLPLALPEESATNFHCSPAATVNPDGTFNMGAVTATASFRFSKWIGPWIERSGARIIIGKGGMTSKDYREHFVPNGAVYLTTVGYGTGALLGRGIKQVKAVHWNKELGLAQAMWVIEAANMGPFIVDGDLAGNSLFERSNQAINENLAELYEGLPEPVLRRYGETTDRRDEVL